MMAFDQAFLFTMAVEKSVYTNHPKDSGGPTKWGVTQKAYASFVGESVAPEVIQALTEEQAKTFYLARYWVPLRCERIDDCALATAIFDTGVLYGPGTAAVLTQNVLNILGHALKSDGVLGDKSIEAINACRRREFLEVLRDAVLLRINHVIEQNPKNEVFRRGWENRANRLLTLIT